MENNYGRFQKATAVDKYQWLSKDAILGNIKSTMCNGEVNTEYKNGEYRCARRKLVLHFDIRNTILVADSVTNVKVEEALNSYLTGVTWGKKEGGKWSWYSDKPSLLAPCPRVETYYKYLEKQLVRVPSDRGVLRKATGDFTQRDIGKKFLPHFQKHLQLLKWNYPTGDPRLTMEGDDGTLYHYILPAFFKLLRFLHKSEREFAVVIRTYGMDASNVLASTKYTLEGHHPMFQKPIPIEVNSSLGKIDRTPTDITVDLNGCKLTAPKSVAKTTRNRSQDRSYTERDIYTMFSNLTGICGFVDDFPFWQNCGYSHDAGKPLWLDPYDPEVHHIFFDDNIRVTDEDSIVDLRIFDSPRDEHARSLTTPEARELADSCLVQPDLLESTTNINYFINKVELCEKKYSKFVKSIHLNSE